MVMVVAATGVLAVLLVLLAECWRSISCTVPACPQFVPQTQPKSKGQVVKGGGGNDDGAGRWSAQLFFLLDSLARGYLALLNRGKRRCSVLRSGSLRLDDFP
jgi:hypothetical protein